MLSTDQKGAIAEAAIAAAAIRLGVGVSKRLGPQRYDLIFDLGSRLLRVQCKWAIRNDDVVVVRCRSCRRGRNGFVRRDYTRDEVDAIAAYQRLGVNWAEAFDFAATLRRTLAGP